MSSLDAARSAKAKALAIFAAIGEVSSVGLTRTGKDYAVAVSLEKELADDVDWPEQIDDVPVVLRIVGRIHKQRQ